MKEVWYSMRLSTLLEKLQTTEHGLSGKEAERRLREKGKNIIPDGRGQSLFSIFISQFQSPLIYLLFIAASIIYVLGDTKDAYIILGVLIFNAVVGATQEGRAQNTLKALKHFVETNTTALRDGVERIIPDGDVVPGDILVIQEGEKVPADARILSAQNLKVDEASFTGESEPVLKVVNADVPADAPLSEQRTMVFKGTHIVSGHAKVVVVATGLSTVIGSIALEVSSIDTEIPLKANIRALSHAIVVVVLSASALLFLSGLAMGYEPAELFSTVVSLAVSVVPEGLPIVMTLVLATGVWRMSRRNALVKRLQAVEALGQARVIAVDKTGTLTRNELIIEQVATPVSEFLISGVGYEPSGTFQKNGRSVDAANHDELLFVGRLATFCANARVSFFAQEKQWKVTGDPTEAALLVLGEKMGFHKDELLEESPFLSEIPFDYVRKYHATVHSFEGKPFLTVIGAPEAVFSLCASLRGPGGVSVPFSGDAKASFEHSARSMSEKGLRVLAVAYVAGVPAQIRDVDIKGLVCAGIVGMRDALREGVAAATARAREAGMRVVMITGDHKITAQAIAADAGIFRFGDMVLTGQDVDSLSDTELARAVGKTSVFARVSPEHKLRIIRAYKRRGEIVAMTGDGVNDAPSLVAADLGVAMGRIGTEVAKEASDIVLLDDNFSSIVSAIEEGRSIYRSMQKVMLYLFSSGLGEMLTIVISIFLGLPLPILAAQIIWLNFVTNAFLDVSLAMDPKEEGLLSGRFEHPSKYIIDGAAVRRMLLLAVPMALGTLFLFTQYADTNLEKAWTVSLSALAVFQWFNVWNCRSDKKSIFGKGFWSNKWLISATAFVVALQFLAVYTPFFQAYLHTVPLSLSDWLTIIPVALSIILVEEVRKFLIRRRKSSSVSALEVAAH